MTNQFTSKEYFNSLYIMYISLILGQVFFAIVTVFLNQSGQISPIIVESKFTLLLVTIFSAFAGIYGSNYFFRLKINMVKQTNGLYNKLVEYRSASIAKWAILEAPSFLAIVAYFLTGDMTFIIITLAIIAFLLMNRPMAEKTCLDLDLDTQHKIRLMDPNSVISEYDK